MSKLATVRAQLQVAVQGFTAGGFTLHADRVKLGFHKITENTGFLSTLDGSGSSTAGPFMVIDPGALLDSDERTKLKHYGVTVRLYMSLDPEADTDFQNIETFAEGIAERWQTIGVMTGVAIVEDVSFERPFIDRVKQATKATTVYTYSIRTGGC